jgi:hypothetical protein
MLPEASVNFNQFTYLIAREEFIFSCRESFGSLHEKLRNVIMLLLVGVVLSPDDGSKVSFRNVVFVTGSGMMESGQNNLPVDYIMNH